MSYRLLRTLRDAGERNQFIFCTHSADIISASLDQSVVFVGPAKDTDENQAISVSEEHEAAHILHLLGQSVGVISLGRRIVLIEGKDASLDKQTYGSILGDVANDLVLVPAGGKDLIKTFLNALETVLSKTIWGIEFFMLCDGDSTIGTGPLVKHPRLRQLSRYHLENYFLDEQVLARAFAVMGETDGSTFTNPQEIEKLLRDLAKNKISYAVALRVAHAVRTNAGNVDLMPNACHDLDLAGLQDALCKRAESEKSRCSTILDISKVMTLAEQEYKRIEEAVSSGGSGWKQWIPAKPLLSQLAVSAKVDTSKLKTVYIREAKKATNDPFSEIRRHFQHFSNYAGSA